MGRWADGLGGTTEVLHKTRAIRRMRGNVLILFSCAPTVTGAQSDRSVIDCACRDLEARSWGGRALRRELILWDFAPVTNNEKGAARRGVVWSALGLVLATGAVAHAEETPARGDGTASVSEGVPPLAWALPAGVTIAARAQDDERLDVYLADGGHAWSEGELEEVVRAALEDAFEAGLAVTGVIPWAERAGEWVPVVSLLPPVAPVPRKSYEAHVVGRGPDGRVAKVLSPVVGARRRGGLSGKVVYVSAGHGFSWDPALDRWTTQRGNTNDIVEDLVSAEAIDQLLTTYLENAGATVFTVRERDMNPQMVIVDAQAGGATSGEGEGAYGETGAWQDSGSGGFAGGLAPYVEGENPFALGASRVTLVAPSATAVATWSFTVPSAGDYRVYAAWVAGPNRAPDAHYVVTHAGGESHFRVDQRRHGSTWVSLGRFHFDRAGALALSNDSAAAGSYVSADAVRVGGGMGDAARGNGTIVPNTSTSGRPRWEENARYHIQFTGAPQSVYRYASDERSDDVGARSRYAAWQNEVGEDAVYVAWHTNAPSPGVGTSTFVYGPNPPDGTYDFTGAAGSDDLGRLLHDEVSSDLKAAIDPNWRDRGFYSAYFGELRKSYNPEMPSALCEVAFHSTASDAAYLKEPKVRMVAARAFYQAITRYFAERDGLATHLSPESPEQVRVAATGPNSARVAWAPSPTDGQDLGGDAATSYRVYRSADGRGWDDGVDASGMSFDVGDLAGGVPTFFRVTAVNDGGESFPSPVVAVLPACEGGPKSLIVYGFYRLDAGLAPREDLSAYGLATVVRVRLAEMNRFDGVVAHAWSLARAGLAFDSAEATAVASEAVPLADYGLVAWVLGEESTVDETFSDREQQLVSAWRGPGRTFITSGAELAWDLGNKGSASDQAFLAALGVAYAADDAGSYSLSWGGGELVIDDGSRGAYDVQFPDVLSAVGGAEVVLRYAGGEPAGVVSRVDGVAIVLGVPLEAVFPDAGRDALVASLLADAGVARAVGCGTEPGPDEGAAEVVEVEAVEAVDADGVAGDADVGGTGDTVDTREVATGEGVTVGRPTREVIGSVRQKDAGCASSSGGSLVSLLVALCFVISNASCARRRKRSA